MEPDDLVDTAPELGAHELQEENAREQEQTEKRITTKFLTKYERGTPTPVHYASTSSQRAKNRLPTSNRQISNSDVCLCNSAVRVHLPVIIAYSCA